LSGAIVLINAETGSEADVLKRLKKVKGVIEAFLVYGVYDIVAKVRADSMDKLKEIMTLHIRRIDNVRSTLTMLIIEE
jgi:DNA-binding Lrp family transcriptional regulator